ncbi:hypothetical protein [Cytobacillus kochii]|uniref:hypothetical protein n=1 Tax=Cytobacillus kochii TaxID=859143 RepID=UPI00203C0FDE|nr:hypothetical protein [Cytobacillus kochii]MCM3325079.1 hypothetical protein [Cytobacillus kochii]MCM3347472.1 hypothetical protein [Cytobacillus kochii]
MGVKMPKKSKPQRPSRDEFELEELGNAVVEAHREKTEVLILLWQRDSIQGVYRYFINKKRSLIRGAFEFYMRLFH